MDPFERADHDGIDYWHWRMDRVYMLVPAQAYVGQWLSSFKEFLYWADDGGLLALRYGNWKLVFQEQRAHGFDVWEEPFVQLRLPKLFNLRMDPFERADHEGMEYGRWRIDRVYALVPAQAYVGQWLSSFKEFPPRMKPGSFSLEKVMDQLTKETGSGK